jgi:hypothetical protein
VQEQGQQERATALWSRTTTNKKRKTKVDDDFSNNDEFFQQLDEEREMEQQKQQKMKKQSSVGKHTTFVMSGDSNDEMAMDRMVDHNIEVAVLPPSSNRNLMMSNNMNAATAPTKEMLLYSRSLLLVDADDSKEQQPTSSSLPKGKTKTVQRKTAVATTRSWKRSKKMNRILTPGARRRNRTKGTAAAHFVVKL